MSGRTDGGDGGEGGDGAAGSSGGDVDSESSGDDGNHPPGGVDGPARGVGSTTYEPNGKDLDGDDRDRDDVEARVDALLYAGETREATLPVADGRLVATSHRLLAYAPDGDGPTLRTRHRVNVTDVALSSSGRDALLRPTAYAVLGGFGLVVAGSTFSLDGLAAAAPSAEAAPGMGGVVSMISGLLALFALLDDLLRVAGALSLLAGAALLGLYARSRTREVIVAVAGAEDLRIPAGDCGERAVAEFATAIAGKAPESGTSWRSKWRLRG